jgi:hypothetical protein
VSFWWIITGDDEGASLIYGDGTAYGVHVLALMAPSHPLDVAAQVGTMGRVFVAPSHPLDLAVSVGAVVRVLSAPSHPLDVAAPPV